MVVNESNSKFYTWNEGKCLGWYLLESPGFNVKLEKIPPKGTTNMHYHKGMSQFFFVKSGILSIETEEGGIIHLNEGEGINLVGEERHRVHNSSNEWVEYVVSEKFVDDSGTYYN